MKRKNIAKAVTIEVVITRLVISINHLLTARLVSRLLTS